MQAVVASVSVVSARAAGWAVVTAGVVLAYFGGVRLARCWNGPDGTPLSWWAATVSGCVAVANPFLASRVYSGQISMVWGYAVLWWLVAALVVTSSRRSVRASVVPALWCALAAAFSLHLLVVGVVVASVFAVLQGREVPPAAAFRRLVIFVAVASVVTATWLVPALLGAGDELGTPGGEAAARLFSSGGPVATLWLRAAGGAGFWRPLPEGALNSMGLVVASSWVATLFIGWRFGGGWSRNLRHLLLGCTVVAIVAAYLGRGPTLSVWSWLLTNVPPVGLFREPGKLGMLAVLLPAAGAAAAAQRLIDRRRLDDSRIAGIGAVAVTAAVVLAMLWSWSSFAASLRPSEYPDAWESARAAASADECSIAVLGDGAYTDPGFTDSRIVANPAEGFFGERAAISLDPGLDGIDPPQQRTAAGRWSAMVNRQYLDGEVLTAEPNGAAAAGVGWIFVNRPVDRPEIAEALAANGFQPVVESDWADLWQTPGGCG